MALDYIDGFSDYSTAQILRYWTALVQSGSEITISAGNGRNASGSLRYTSAGNSGKYIRKTLTSGSVTTRTIGFACKVSTVGATTLCTFLDGASGQIDVRLTATGALTVTRSGTVLATTTYLLSSGVFYYIELSVLINSSTGTYDLHVNGVSRASGTGNTQSTANATTSGFALVDFPGGGLSAGQTVDFSDLYVSSDATFLGDCRVETKLPTGDGVTTNFTKSTGATNFGNVDEATSNDDTDYNFSAAAGDIDLYTYPALSTASGAIQAVMTMPVLRNDNAGSVTAASVYRSGGTNYFGTTNSIGSTTYNNYPDIQLTDPNTGLAWTLSNLNACQFGLKRVA